MAQYELTQLVAGRLRLLDTGDLYGLLGVPPGTSPDGLKTAYLALAKLLHPDRLGKATPGLRADAERLFRGLNQAYAALSSAARTSTATVPGVAVRRGAPPSRSRSAGAASASPTGMYSKKPAAESLEEELERLARIPREALGDQLEGIVQVLLQQGAVCLQRADFAGAVLCYQRALDLKPRDPLVSLRLGWAIFSDTRLPAADRLERARPHLEHAAARAPYNEDARYCFAQYWREVGDDAKCRHELEAALRCNPKHPRAAAELSEMGTRGALNRPPPAPQQSTGFGALWRRRYSR